VASVSKDGSGWRILFVCPSTGKRHTVRTGRCAKKNAETAKNMVERLVEARKLGTAIDGQTAEWLKAIDDKLRGRLVKVGLIDLPEVAMLGPFLNGYIDQRRRRGDVTDSTIETWGHTRRNLVTYFGPDKDMRTITPADADDWAAWLRSHEGLAENTTRKRCQFAKTFLSVAVQRKLLPENPFGHLVGTVVAVPDRQFFVPRESVDALLDQCHGPEYRLLLIVARYLGVRVPSEIVPLRWQDVDWENMRIVITSPKTKRHRGGDKRLCPIFPEVAPALREAWEAAPDGSEWIFPSIRSVGKNLRTWLERAILRSGLTPWPRLWQNFRATRSTELADQYPSHVAAAWLGHTERIADRHYRQTTGAHYDRAIAEPTGDMPGQSQKPAEDLAQKPAQYPHESGRKQPNANTKTSQETASYEALRCGTNHSSGGQGTRTLNRQAGT